MKTVKRQAPLDPRRAKILDYVTAKGFATPDELAALHDVAAITVRRDLLWLENAGLLKRVHGGAIPCEGSLAKSHIAGRMHTATDEKRFIASTAAAMLQQHDRIFLDAGSTCCFLAEALQEDLDLTVITHSLDALKILSGKRNISVVSLGGELDGKLNAFVGPMTEAALQSFHANKTFLGVSGVAVKTGCSINSLTEERIKALMVERAAESYVVADSSKFGITCLRSVIPLSKIAAVITDESLGESLRKDFRDAGVTLMIATPGE